MASELQKCCRVEVTSCLNGLLHCRLRSMKCPALVFAALVCLLHSSIAAPRLSVADAPHEISCGAHAQPPFIALVDVLGIDPSEVAVHAALGATPPLHLPTLLTRVCPRSRRRRLVSSHPLLHRSRPRPRSCVISLRFWSSDHITSPAARHTVLHDVSGRPLPVPRPRPPRALPQPRHIVERTRLVLIFGIEVQTVRANSFSAASNAAASVLAAALRLHPAAGLAPPLPVQAPAHRGVRVRRRHRLAAHRHVAAAGAFSPRQEHHIFEGDGGARGCRRRALQLPVRAAQPSHTRCITRSAGSGKALGSTCTSPRIRCFCCFVHPNYVPSAPSHRRLARMMPPLPPYPHTHPPLHAPHA